MDRTTSKQIEGKPYVYNFLERPTQIRLLRLLGESKESLKCSIDNCQAWSNDVSHQGDITNSVPFVALSYTWGEQTKVSTMFVVDDLGEELGTIQLTKSLNDALCDLRDSPEVLENVFWIDQISINQSDMKERGQQVGLMGKIYKTASKVMVYLGTSKPDDEMALDLLTKIYSHFEPLIATMEFHHVDKLRLRFSDKDRVPPELCFEVDAASKEWRAAMDIVYGFWNTRLWILQETCLNENMIMLKGKRTMSWGSIGGIALLQTVQLLPFADVKRKLILTLMRRFMIRKRLVTERGQWHLHDLIATFSRVLDCSDERDYIFALLGLASDTELLGIEADYAQSYCDTLLNVASRMIRCRGLSPLFYWHQVHLEGSRKDFKTHLPSWVPLWDNHPHGHSMLWEHDNQLWDQSDSYSASGDLEPRVHIGEGHEILQIEGLRIGTVVNKVAELGSSICNFDSSEECQELKDAITKVEEIFEHKPNWMAELAWTLTAVQDWPSYLPTVADTDPPSRSICLLKEILEKGLEVYATGASPTFNTLASHLLEVDFQIFDYLLRLDANYGRAIAQVENGRICLAPGHVQPGDIVTCLLGGSVLYVLRPCGDKFQYVGDAWMYGFMKGETLEIPDWESELETFQMI